MKFYIELTLLPSADISPYFLWTKVFQLIHLALVEIQDPNNKVPVGVAFPEYNSQKQQLGCKLRLFALDEIILEKLSLHKKLSHFLDYVHLTQIRLVPDHIKSYVFYRRKQPNRSQAKFRRTIKRKASREGISLEEATEQLRTRLSNKVKKTKDGQMTINAMPSLAMPYIQMKSLSSGEHFHLFITKAPANGFTNNGFNTYGLSDHSSVPEF